MPAPAYKRCSTCGERKPLDEFHRHKGTRDGRNSVCKPCAIKRATAWNRDHPSRRAEIVKQEQKRHPERMAAQRKRHRERHRAKFVEHRKRHEARHPEKTQARRKLEDAVQKGYVSKPDICSRCLGQVPAVDLHGHHHDYSKPLDVEWLCRVCHNAEHQQERADA